MNNQQKKVLIISYYWPPSGGAGVQRWLKLSKYLQEFGVEVHVLTVDEKKASYTHIDKSLLKDVHPDVKIYKTNSFEINTIYGKIAGKKNVPSAGFSNVDNSSFLQRMVNAIRSNFFIPDPRIGWRSYAVKAAKKIIKEQGIETVITTSPPHSTQMVGLTLKRKLKIKWIVDLRDPWTDIYYYPLLGHSFLSHRINLSYERKVLEESDSIITVSEGVKKLFMMKSEKLTSDKISIVYNGFDEADFKNLLVKEKKKTFTISYIGTMSDQYQPWVLIEVLNKLAEENEQTFELTFVGLLSKRIQEKLEQSKFKVNFMGLLPHSEVAQYQHSADLLLLIIPKVPNSEGILSGKLFEYLGSGNRIIALGPENGDINYILKSCNAGRIFNWKNKSDIHQFMENELNNFKNRKVIKTNKVEIGKYSRFNQAKAIEKLI